MVAAKTVLAAVEGWFTAEGGAHLIGSKCRTCGTFAFPRATFFCRNPICEGAVLDAVPLSNRGKVWSFTVNRYQPPPPYVSPTDQFEPFGVAAVELAEEKMVVMGQVVAGSEVAVGDDVELVLETLYEDDEHRYLIWKWQPLGRSDD